MDEEEIEFVDEPMFEKLVEPKVSKRRKAAKQGGGGRPARNKGKKRGSGIRVTMRERLRAQRKALRLRHWKALREYKKQYKRLTQGIAQLTGRKAAPKR